MAKITLNHVKMGYTKKKLAVDDVSLTIGSGEFFVLLGPSGCGKTSLLRLISGITSPSEGDVLFDDVSVKNVAVQDRNTAMVFQNFALYPHRTVYRNISYPLESRKMPKEEIDRKVREIAEVFGISDLLDRRPRVLSGGQRQLVAIARAMVRRPVVFLLDEPFANLDVELRETLRAQVRKAHRLMPETTFIYVTHDQNEAMTLSDRIAIMKDGKIESSGSAAEVYAHPDSLFAAEFLGSPKINLFPASLRADGDSVIAEIAGQSLVLPERKSGMDLPEEVIVGIRPEQLLTEAENTEPDALRIRTKFSGLARAGTGVQILFSVDGLPGSFSSLSSEGFPDEEGKEMDLLVRKDAVLVFDKNSGKNIYK
ncbi:MAG: ABC transporter ATP-binding protein [Lachnospiraceae bacterium]|nr:ABC transporter ATP-binding protein [Lachnospiraceae bacterium]